MSLGILGRFKESTTVMIIVIVSFMKRIIQILLSVYIRVRLINVVLVAYILVIR